MVDDLEAALEQSREIAVLERAPQSDIVQISSERMRLTQFVSFRWKVFRRLPSWSILEDGTLISVLVVAGGCSSSPNLFTRWWRAKPTLSIRRCDWPLVIHADPIGSNLARDHVPRHQRVSAERRVVTLMSGAVIGFFRIATRSARSRYYSSWFETSSP